MYTLTVSQMKELDLFDNFAYKYIKDIVREDNDGVTYQVEIEYLECDEFDLCKTRFTFDKNENETYVGYENTVSIVREYNKESAYGIMLSQLYEDDDNDEDDDEIAE